jgi:nicotinamide-nucleotide amidase
MLPSEVIGLAAERGVTIATAESLTGGAVASAIVTVPGASAVFVGGVVAYTERVKERVLGVDPAAIAEHGVVSEQVALAMARGAIALLHADFAVATTGVAGPGPSDGEPQGTVWIAAVGPDSGRAEVHAFPGDREAVRGAAVEAALDMLVGLIADTVAKGETEMEHN